MTKCGCDMRTRMVGDGCHICNIERAGLIRTENSGVEARNPQGGRNMKPSRMAKEEGLKSLSQVSRMTGQSLQTLRNWANNKPDLFRIVLKGCKVEDAERLAPAGKE